MRGAWFTTAPRGDYTDESIDRLRAEGRIHESPRGLVYVKYFLIEGPDGWYRERRIDCLWDDEGVRPLRHRPKAEQQGYETQKPEGLLERIIGWASPPGGLVLDPFGGSGTTAAVAHRLGRRCITIDAGGTAVRITRRRLLEAGVPHMRSIVAGGSEPPAAKATVERTPEGGVALTGCIPADDEASTSGRHWSDFVESWAVGPLPAPGTPAEVDWWSVRSRLGTPVSLVSPPLPHVGPMLVRVVDVTGGEALIDLDGVGG